MKFAVLQFPGSNCDQDCVHVLRSVFGYPTRLLWHKEYSVGDADAVIIPGGFSYGDYLRTGSIARFSPVMGAVKEFADNGGLVLGICNGFQILCEAGLLPGALIRNRSLQFRCEHVYLQVASHNSPFTGQIPEDKNLRIPSPTAKVIIFVTTKPCSHSRTTTKFCSSTLTPKATLPTTPIPTDRAPISPAFATRNATSAE